jgi:ABC-2 type transport system ATP-binding protein
MPPSLELRDVRKSYGKFVAVDGVSFAVPETGSIFGLLGPNGAGKTTCIRMIMDIIAPDSGDVLLFGRSRGSEELRRTGYLPEERGLYPKMTVLDQLLFLGEIHGRKRRDLLPAIDRWLERVDLAKWKKSKVEELSKGMQQKVQLIGMLLHEPELLILDEPFSGLDPINQELFRELFQEHRRQGRTVVLSTHGMEMAERLCDHICLISHGRVILTGGLKEIKRQVAGNAYRLVAEGNLSLVEGLPEVEHAVVHEGTVKLLLRPEVEGSDALRRMVELVRVHEFRSEEPELEQIFLKAVRDAA